MNNKDVLKQYVNTGNQIDEYQFNKLNNNLLKSYLHARLITCMNEIKNVIHTTNGDIKAAVEWLENFAEYSLSVEEYDALSDKQRNELNALISYNEGEED